MMEPISKIPWAYVIIACATLGLAPFTPPHIWEKLNMLINGTLKRPVDWFDLFFHGIPWILLVLKTIATIIKKGSIPGQ